MTPLYASRSRLKPHLVGDKFNVAMSLREVLCVKQIVKSCPLKIGERCLMVDLVLLVMHNFDVILNIV